jgi:hypothetical protein
MYSNSLYYITLLYVFTCLYNYIDIVLCTAYFVFVFVLSFPHPGLYWIYGNKDDDDDDDDDDDLSGPMYVTVYDKETPGGWMIA